MVDFFRRFKVCFLKQGKDLNLCKNKSPVKWKGTLFVFCLNACIVNDIGRKIQGRRKSIY